MKQLRTLHRWIGLFVALFVIQISITGILLNHTDDLELSSNYVEQPLILDWYGLKPTINSSFLLDSHWFIESDGTVFANAKVIGKGELKAVTQCARFYCLQIDNTVVILTQQFDIVDRLATPAGTIIGRTADNILAASSPAQQYISKDLLNWSEFEGPIIPHDKRQISAEAEEVIRQTIVAKTLPWERVVQDMHSGRILGKAGVWLVDIFAVFLVLLAISGLLMWARVYRAQK